MFDCGSQQYLDIARKAVLPALRRLGVARIDVLVISHADLDHFGGVLDLAARMPVRRVLMPPHVQREAAADPHQRAARGRIVATPCCTGLYIDLFECRPWRC